MPSSHDGTLSIVSAPLTIRANDASKYFGEMLPTFTAAGVGFVNGDTLASLSGTLAFTTSATATSAVGTYAVMPGGLSSPNYTITFVNGTLAIIKAATTLNLSSTPNPSRNNQAVELRAYVGAVAPGAGTPTGSVEFRHNDILLAFCRFAEEQFAGLFVAENSHWFDQRGACGGNQCRQPGDHQHDRDNARQRDRVGGRDTIQHVR
jgi:hypothetical protein